MVWPFALHAMSWPRRRARVSARLALCTQWMAVRRDCRARRRSSRSGSTCRGSASTDRRDPLSRRWRRPPHRTNRTPRTAARRPAPSSRSRRCTRTSASASRSRLRSAPSSRPPRPRWHRRWPRRRLRRPRRRLRLTLPRCSSRRKRHRRFRRARRPTARTRRSRAARRSHPASLRAAHPQRSGREKISCLPVGCREARRASSGVCQDSGRRADARAHAAGREASLRNSEALVLREKTSFRPLRYPSLRAVMSRAHHARTPT